MTLFFSDIHRQSNSKYLFLEDLKDEALRYVLTKYGNSVDYVINAGDTFDNKLFNVELAFRQVRIYRECLYEPGRCYEILGNHEPQGRVISPMSIFAEGAAWAGKAMTVVGRKPVKVGPYLMRGWDSNIEFPISNARYLVSHIRVTEWAKSVEKAFSVNQLNVLSFDRVICGDNHTPGEKGKVISIGTLCSSSFKDKDIEAGAVLFDEDHNTFERIKIPNYPVFRLFTVTPETTEPDAALVKNNIVRVEFKGPQKWITSALRQKWQMLMWSMQPRHFEFGEEHYIGETKLERQNSELPLEGRYDVFAKSKEWDEPTAKVGTEALR